MNHSDPNSLLKVALGHGFEPFPWQTRLLRLFLDGEVPRALDLHTGLGKTSVMQIWLVARACGATHLPRRLVYVVDRRAVVDQATRVAEQLASWVGENEQVRSALMLEHLPVSTLRGQFADNRRWLEDPASPAIVVGTVDMIGSRVLFSGYACSRKMRPFHAGLLGCDTLFVVDEAHLVPPFEHMLEAIARPEFWPERPEFSGAKRNGAGRPSQVLSLSATGRTYENTFGLTEEDRVHHVVRQRIEARKAIEWRKLDAKDKLADHLAEAAWEIAESAGAPQRVVVFSSRREDAESAHKKVLALARAARGRKADLPRAELLVGARRVRERMEAGAQLEELGFVAGSQRAPATDHCFLFATSAGEVGVDLDADHAVMDVVAWERMVQRLGRVHRRGDDGARVARVVVLALPDKNDWLEKVEPLVDLLPRLDDHSRLASPAALEELKAKHGAAVEAASTSAPLRPDLNSPTVEAWAMTSLREHTGRPEVAPWLRGWIENEAQTSVVWRRFLPPADRRAYIEAAPSQLSERLETATYRVSSWLFSRIDKVATAQERVRKRAQSEASTPDDPPIATQVAEDHAVAWVLDAAGELEDVFEFDRLKRMTKRERERFHRVISGRQLIVDARLGGLSDTGLLDEKSDEEALAADTDAWTSSVVPLPRIWRRRPANADQAATPEHPWRETLRIPWSIAAEADEVTEWLCIDRHAEGPTSEESRSASREQALDEHQAWVATEATRLADALDLPANLRTVLTVAARLHDEGKRSARWQRAFSAPPGSEPLAKTRGPVRVKMLDGYRHEFGSLPIAQQSPLFLDLPPESQELVLHLIAAHHGGARPTIRTTGCDDAPPSMVEARATEVARRYVNLQQRWGPWRLAWLEALLRSADQRASRKNDEQDRKEAG